MSGTYLKDDHLAEIARRHNVARFASFGPGRNPALRHACIDVYESYRDLDSSLRALFAVAPTVNVRVFGETPMKSAPFDYGLASIGDASARVRKYSAEGLYTIVNETIDVNDGGVSGVSLGGIIEFAPKDTPRAVEKAGVASVSHRIGLELLRLVYGFQPEIPDDPELRVEFSLHPNRVGLRQSHTILWESEHIDSVSLPWHLRWPNRFSRFIGDKAFGLLVGSLLGARIPKTTVIGRDVAPFVLGEDSNSRQVWLRTCPREPVPGKFPTLRTWEDPFILMHDVDPDGTMLASVLAQEGVDAKYSGASLPDGNGRDQIQGVAGFGDRFMLGDQEPMRLPDSIQSDVQKLILMLRETLGPVRIEWAHDGDSVWLLQLHTVEQVSTGDTIYPGEPSEWIDFDPRVGLDALREIVAEVAEVDFGVRVTLPIGITSHVGDILRKAKIPARIVPSGSAQL